MSMFEGQLIDGDTWEEIPFSSRSSLTVRREHVLGFQVTESEISMPRHSALWYQAAKGALDGATFDLQLICPVRQDEGGHRSVLPPARSPNSQKISAAQVRAAIKALDEADVPEHGRVYHA